MKPGEFDEQLRKMLGVSRYRRSTAMAGAANLRRRARELEQLAADRDKDRIKHETDIAWIELLLEKDDHEDL